MQAELPQSNSQPNPTSPAPPPLESDVGNTAHRLRYPSISLSSDFISGFNEMEDSPPPATNSTRIRVTDLRRMARHPLFLLPTVSGPQIIGSQQLQQSSIADATTSVSEASPAQTQHNTQVQRRSGRTRLTDLHHMARRTVFPPQFVPLLQSSTSLNLCQPSNATHTTSLSNEGALLMQHSNTRRLSHWRNMAQTHSTSHHCDPIVTHVSSTETVPVMENRDHAMIDYILPTPHGEGCSSFPPTDVGMQRDSHTIITPSLHISESQAHETASLSILDHHPEHFPDPLQQRRRNLHENYCARRASTTADQISQQNTQQRLSYQQQRRRLSYAQPQFLRTRTIPYDERRFGANSTATDVQTNTQIQGLIKRQLPRHHNSARNFRDSVLFDRYRLPDTRSCPHCQALLFLRETSDFCCKYGKSILPPVQSPQDIMNLYTDQSPIGRHFRQNIRPYNHIFSFTSMGVHLDQSLANGRDGVFTFRAQGSIYHRIGGMLPAAGNRPRFLQIYIYDTEHETENRLAENDTLRPEIVERIKNMLNEHNPFVTVFRQLGQRSDIQNCRLIIREQPRHQKQYTLPTASEVAAIVIGGEQGEDTNGRDIVVQSISGNPSNIPETAGYYDPLQYPLLLPCGSYGWDINTRNNHGRKISCRAYYAYMLQIRPNSQSLLLRGGRLLHQYAVDNYVKIDTNKLRWYRKNQDKIRCEWYQGLQDALNAGENNAANVGRRTILPSSYLGGPRDMYQRYQDAMALVHKYGKPDLFITMTCNPEWDEILSKLHPGQTAQDRPDLTTRVFRAKFEELKKDIYDCYVLGKVVAHVHVIEFQKRGLPHVHMLIILSDEDKLRTPDDYDKVVRADIPDPNVEPELYYLVLRWMIHGPCGIPGRKSPCERNGPCKRNFPMQFSDVTTEGNDSFPIYKRPDNGRSVVLDEKSDLVVDNRWVVPYNPWLLKKYNCHINVEVCSSISCVKYLYKYVYKGPDHVVFGVHPGPNYDEIQHFQDGRWISAQEAFWRIFKFPLSKIYPSVERLQVHLPNKQQVRYYAHQTISDVLRDDQLSKTMLTEFFALNARDEGARKYLYREIPEHYCWLSTEKTWQLRRSGLKAIGRVYTVSPSEGDRFYLRMLLNHIRGPTSFDDLLTVDNVGYLTFKQAAQARGLLEDDGSIQSCMLEASRVKMPSSLRVLFVTLLIFCEPTNVRRLWDEFWSSMSEDFVNSSAVVSEDILQNQVLCEIRALLRLKNRYIKDYDLPPINESLPSAVPRRFRHSLLLQNESSVTTPPEDLLLLDCLNVDQANAYKNIMEAITTAKGGVFFVDGPGGTGKTFLYRAILASVRKEKKIIIATATSGIAATILPGGQTAHSRFKLPLSPKPYSTCSISKQEDLAQLIRMSEAIIWDEITVIHRWTLEAFERTLRDIMDTDAPFGGKVIITGGDFRQTLPIVPRGTIAQTVGACISKSDLWKHVKVLQLKENMRARNDPSFSSFLLQIGNGAEPVLHGDMINIPYDMVMPWENESSVDNLIEQVFPDLSNNETNKEYFTDRALLTPLNDCVNELNDRVLSSFPGTEVTYYSFDSVEDDVRNLYQPEFLNTLSAGGLPPHKLVLKLDAPIMLLRNINPAKGLCNGTRLLCKGFDRNMIWAEIITGHAAGNIEFIPRIPMKSAEDVNLPFQLLRRQFPLRLSFALTINKAQGQTIKNVGIFLPASVFTHGQLYVALSRGISRSSTKIMVKNGSIEGQPGVYTANVVYKDVLLP